MWSSTQLRCAKTLAAAMVVVGIGAGAVHAAEPVRAVWQVQEINLPYFALTTFYSCDGLRDKMRVVLEQLRVREDFLVSINGCTELRGPERLLSVNMVVANAVPASDEAAKKFAADPKRAQLLARLQKKGKAVSDEPFDAMPTQVVLRAKDRSASGASGDCELLEQMRRDVLPKLGAKVLKDDMHCTPHQGTVGNPRLELELLVPVPAKA